MLPAMLFADFVENFMTFSAVAAVVSGLVYKLFTEPQKEVTNALNETNTVMNNIAHNLDTSNQLHDMRFQACDIEIARVDQKHDEKHSTMDERLGKVDGRVGDLEMVVFKKVEKQ